MKKGEISQWGIILIILAVIGIIILSYLILGVKGGSADSVVDSVCRLSNTIKGFGAGTTQVLPEGLQLRRGRICFTRHITLRPDDWTKCNSSYKRLFYSGDMWEKSEALRGCLAEQVADLLRRCWYMGGEGYYDPGSFICFTVSVSQVESDLPKDYSELRRRFKSIIERKLSCTPSYCDFTKFKYFKDFNTYERNIVDPLIENSIQLLINNAVLEYYKDKLLKYGDFQKGILGLNYCVKEGIEPEEVVSDLLDQTTSINSILSKINMNREGCICNEEGCWGDFLNELRENLQSTAEKISKAKQNIYSILDESLTEEAKNTIVERIYTYQDGEGITHTIVNPSSEELNKLQEEAEEISLTQKSFIEAITTTTYELSTELPSFEPVDEKYITEIMKNLETPQGQPFCAILENSDYGCGSDDELNFLDNYRIRKNELFEIGYCDPPMPIGSGVASRFRCNLAEGQQIQVVAGGRGAGGILRSGSPYPRYCKILNLRGLPVVGEAFGEIEKVCQDITGGIFGRAR